MSHEPFSAQTIVVGGGELAVVDDPQIVLVTHALDNCVAVGIWDPVSRVAGLLQFLLPDSTGHEQRARLQPEAFADTGIPLLFDAAFLQGLERERTVAWLVGGAERPGASITPFMIGSRNVAAARRLLAEEGVAVRAESIGGPLARTVFFSASSGRLRIKTSAEPMVLQ